MQNQYLHKGAVISVIPVRLKTRLVNSARCYTRKIMAVCSMFSWSRPIQINVVVIVAAYELESNPITIQ